MPLDNHFKGLPQSHHIDLTAGKWPLPLTSNPTCLLVYQPSKSCYCETPPPQVYPQDYLHTRMIHAHAKAINKKENVNSSSRVSRIYRNGDLSPENRFREDREAAGGNDQQLTWRQLIVTATCISKGMLCCTP
eukprot:3971935-Amphidinium_carterae.1